jgi:SpoIIAA-like
MRQIAAAANCRCVNLPQVNPAQTVYDAPVRVFTIDIVGHLTTEMLGDELERVGSGLRVTSTPSAVLFDVLQMTSYDPPIRDLYITWHGKNRDRIGRVAVVTDKSLWRMIVSKVGLAVRAQVRTFSERRMAEEWCASEEPVAARR